MYKCIIMRAYSVAECDRVVEAVIAMAAQGRNMDTLEQVLVLRLEQPAGYADRNAILELVRFLDQFRGEVDIKALIVGPECSGEVLLLAAAAGSAIGIDVVSAALGRMADHFPLLKSLISVDGSSWEDVARENQGVLAPDVMIKLELISANLQTDSHAHAASLVRFIADLDGPSD